MHAHRHNDAYICPGLDRRSLEKQTINKGEIERKDKIKKDGKIEKRQ